MGAGVPLNIEQTKQTNTQNLYHDAMLVTDAGLPKKIIESCN